MARGPRTNAPTLGRAARARSHAPWLRAATAILAIALGAPAGIALADTTGTVLTATPSTNLNPSGQGVSVSGSGFGTNGTGFIQQCIVIDGVGTEDCSVNLGTFMSNASGSFGPVSVNVSETFTAGGQLRTCSDLRPCSLFAAMDAQAQNDHAPLSFSPRTIAVFRPTTSQFFARGRAPEVTQYGVAGDIPVRADYNGDGVPDVAVYRPSTGQWFIRNASPIPEVVSYGAACSTNCATAGDIPVPADYDGDGDVDIAVYRPSTGEWFVRNGSPEVTQYGAGCGACASPTEVPVPANYTGDGKAEKAIYRKTTGQWFVRGGLEAVPYGAVGDIPVPADYDGEGHADFAVFRPSTGQWFRRGIAPEVVQYGAGGACCDDVPVPANYIGTAAAEVAVYRRSTGQWLVRNGSPEVVPYGAAGDIPLALPYAVRVVAGFSQ